MSWSYTYYSPKLHATFNQGDMMYIQGTAYTSTDKSSVGYNYDIPTQKRFYGIYSSAYSYAPICFMDEYGNPQYYIEDSTLVGGGTVDIYIMSFNANGGSGAPGNMSKTYGLPFAFPSTIPTRTGYNFCGWANSNVHDGKLYTAGQQATDIPDGNIEWWAQWEPWKHTVSFNANGGSGAPGNQIKTYGQSMSISTIKPTRIGYTFQGWGTTASDATVDYAAGGAYGRDQNGGTYTLYAIWKINSFSLTVNPNGGSWDGSTSKKSFTLDYNATKSIPNATRTGYSFGGWMRSGSGTLSGTTFRQGAGNSTLTASWNINTYVLTVNPNGGSWNGSAYSQNFTQNYNTTKSIGNPTRTGYTFKGWTQSGSGTLSGTTYTFGAGVGTLTAQWERIVYTVTFNASANGGVPNSTKFVNHGDALGILPIPTKLYYKFVGWFTSVNGGTQITSSQVITSNQTYYAHFVIDASATLMINGQRKPVIVYVRTDGIWKKALSMVRIKGSWKNSTGSS